MMEFTPIERMTEHQMRAELARIRGLLSPTFAQAKRAMELGRAIDLLAGRRY